MRGSAMVTRRVSTGRMQFNNKSFGFRSLAAAVLLGFMSAQALCFAHCSRSTGRTPVSKSCCKAGGNLAEGADETSRSHVPSGSCQTLKSALVTGHVPFLGLDFSLLYTAPAQDLAQLGLSRLPQSPRANPSRFC